MKIFLAAPFTTNVITGKGLEEGFAALLRRLIKELRDSGHEVFSAHEREQWGRAIDPAEKALQDDLSELRAADVVIALIGDPPSPGVQMELGGALILEKPILALVEMGSERPYLLAGMHQVTTALVREYESIEKILTHIKEFFATLKAG
ncbi:MAG: nucleoside 2-deoxyribosyltransferase [Prosthecobacter sp.]